MIERFILSALGLVAYAAAAGAQVGYSNLTPERLWDLARVGAPVVSPDGRWVVFTLTRYPRGQDAPSVDLWLVGSDGRSEPRQLTRNPGPDFDPSWSSDSDSILYASQRGDEPPQVYLLNLRGGEPKPMTRFPTGAVRPRWRSGGERLLFEALTYPDIGNQLDRLVIRTSRSEELRASALATESRLIRRGDLTLADQAVIHLFEQDVESGAVRDLMVGFDRAIAVNDMEWDVSPDGRQVVVSANVTPPPYRMLNRDVFLIDLESGESRNLTADNPADDHGPQFSPDGSFVVYGRKRTQDSLSEFSELVRHTLRGDKRETLTDPARIDPTDWLVDTDARQVYFVAEDAGRRALFRIGAAGGKARKVFSEGSVSGVAHGPKDQLFFVNESLFEPPTLVRTDVNGLHRQELTPFNRAYLETTRMGSVRELRFPGSSDETVHGFLVTPPGFDESRRWPVIIALHGGPHSAWLDEFHFRWNLAVLASPGYLVAAINVHGSTGYGSGFAASVVGDPVRPAARDVAAAVDTLVARPFVDPDRIALVGGSYGGYLGAWVLTQSDRFRAAVLHAGVIDLVSQYASDFPWGREQTYGALPWQDPSLLAQWSPSHRANDISTPVLLLHGERDYRVPLSHSLLLHNVLTGRGVPSRLVLFPGEGHRIDRREPAEIWWNEIFDWLDRHLHQPE